MPKIRYQSINLSEGSLAIVAKANEIIDTYTAQGFRLTLRQLYYQFVARDLLANTVQSYKRLGSIINDARLAGLIDWYAIEDRTRSTAVPSSWDAPGDILQSAASSFRIDKWEGQDYRPEVWIEKEALAGVIAPTCHKLQISYLSCRGYTSQSEMWSSAQRLARIRKAGQIPMILHFGDHDPSGMDMTRDIRERLSMFTGRGVKLDRLALNMDQVEQYSPPPNPAKTTDARFAGYLAEFGSESWELDALEPRMLADLIRNAVLAVRDEEKWDERVAEEEEHRALLGRASERWDDVREMLQA